MPRLNTPTSSRAEFYDRNPATLASGVGANITENSNAVERIAYTVPTDKKANITLAEVFVTAQVAATTTTTTDVVGVRCFLTPNGGAAVEVGHAFLNSAGYILAQQDHIILGNLGVLVAGDVITLDDLFIGDAAGTGRVGTSLSLVRTEFDA